MILYIVLIFILGSAIGSFLNVVIDRTMRGESILGRSHCDHCKATLASVDLVPIFSFVTFGAKCRYCKKPLSWQYPFVEGVTALLFSSSFWILVSRGQLNLVELAVWFFVICTMVVVFMVDLKFSLIPTTFVYATSLVVLVYNYFTLSPDLFLNHIFAAFGASIFFLIIVLVTFGRGMGQGDVVLGFLMGLVLGVNATVLALFLAFFTGAVFSIFLIILGRKKFGNTIPFAPFLVLGFFLALFWAKEITGWYLGVLI